MSRATSAHQRQTRARNVSCLTRREGGPQQLTDPVIKVVDGGLAVDNRHPGYERLLICRTEIQKTRSGGGGDLRSGGHCCRAQHVQSDCWVSAVGPKGMSCAARRGDRGGDQGEHRTIRVGRITRIEPHPDGLPQVTTLITERPSPVQMVLELKEFGRSAIFIPCNVVVELKTDCGVGAIVIVDLPQQLKQAVARLVLVAECARRSAVLTRGHASSLHQLREGCPLCIGTGGTWSAPVRFWEQNGSDEARSAAVRCGDQEPGNPGDQRRRRTGAGSLASAPSSGRRGRRFKSGHPDQSSSRSEPYLCYLSGAIYPADRRSLGAHGQGLVVTWLVTGHFLPSEVGADLRRRVR